VARRGDDGNAANRFFGSAQVLGAAALATLLAFLGSSPALAQVRYTDSEGVVHFVDSLDQVPEKYRAGATGRPTPRSSASGPASSSSTSSDSQAVSGRTPASAATPAPVPPQTATSDCEARLRSWEATRPSGGVVATREEMANALGPNCDVDEILARQLRQLDTGDNARQECKQSLAGSDFDQRQMAGDLSDPATRKEVWTNMAQAIGTHCADLLMPAKP